MNAEQLLALADRCEAGAGIDRELDEAIWLALDLKDPICAFRWMTCIWGVTPEVGGFHQTTPPYTGSLDTAASLMPAGWAVTVETWPGGGGQESISKVHLRQCREGRKGLSGMWHSATKDGAVNSEAPTEARARCAAALRAMAHEAGESSK